MLSYLLLASNIAIADDPVVFDCPGAADIKLNEVLVDPGAEGGDDGHEWVELYNAGTESVNLAGWSLKGGSSSLGLFIEFESEHTMSPGSYLLVGETEVAGADVVAELNLGNASSSADIIQLIDCSGLAADTLVYGSPNDDEWLDDSGSIATSLAPKPSAGVSLGRISDGHDTDASEEDFVTFAEPSPGEENVLGDDDPPDDDPPPVSDCPGATDIKLNEALVDPGTEGGDDGHEWVELYNAGTESVNLAGWSLKGGTSSLGLFIGFDSGHTLAPGDHMLVGETEVAGADVIADLSLGNASSNADSIQLIDCSGLAADTLVYGSPNEDEWEDDSGSIATSLAPKPGTDLVLARISDGVDTNACASDWIVTEEATPGASNPDHDPVVCIEGAQNIKINEFMVDPDAWLVGEDVTDSELEWVELFNASDAAVSVAGWQIQWGKSGSYSGSKVFAADATLGPGAYMLVGGSLVDGTDATASFDMGNAGSNSDALRLVDCADAVQDTVVYGPNNDDGWLDDEDEVATSFAESPGKEKSSARAVNGVDSNQSGTDFVVSDSPTPGDLNVLPDPDEEADEGASDDGGASGDGGASDDGGPFDPGEWSSSDTGEDWDVDDTKSGCMGCASTRTRPNIWWCVFPILAFARRRRLAATTRS